MHRTSFPTPTANQKLAAARSIRATQKDRFEFDPDQKKDCSGW
jgi:hypothetical protein